MDTPYKVPITGYVVLPRLIQSVNPYPGSEVKIRPEVVEIEESKSIYDVLMDKINTPVKNIFFGLV
ncbi:MAG: hypothetical protein NC548_05435 [Lachnospiraceae bacterium]|nr:hypothetical protein [Lachnospiraceae bacterium]